MALGKNVTIEGQADNLESVYGFFRNIKDYNPSSAIKLQKLGLASKTGSIGNAIAEGIDASQLLTSMNADFYEFKISDAPEEVKAAEGDEKDSAGGGVKLPNLEPIED